MAKGSDEHGLELIPLPAIQKRILVVRERHVEALQANRLAFEVAP
jgi:hypothetical protein